MNFTVNKSGHPINIITGALDVLLLSFDWFCVKIGKSQYCTRTIFIYFLYHALAVVCVYKEWTPAYFNSYPKDNVETMILLTFMVSNAVPFSDFK